MRNSIFTIIFCFIASLTLGQKVLQLSFDEISGTTSTIDSISSANYTIKNNFNRPERVSGVKGNALRLDGWSTWIEQANYSFASSISNTMTIEAWHATEAFTMAAGGIISQISGPTGFSLEVSPFGKVIWAFHADGQFYILVTTQPLPKYQWNHIVATVDLPNQVAKIYVNGVEEQTQSLSSHNALSMTSTATPLYVGRQTNNIQNLGFTISALQGALDEVNVYSNILSASDIFNTYQAGSGATVDLSIDPAVRHQGDHLLPQYHPKPNTHWANEAYGLTYYNGKYHLFFQKNPNAPDLFFMHWGHLSSPDLVNWTEERITISPENVPSGFDNVGCWSGTTIKDTNDVPKIIYTGVNGVYAGIGGATPNDANLIDWTKDLNNPLIPTVPNTVSNLDFRDPYIWKEGNTYYMVIGSGRGSPEGGMLFQYSSTDLVNWTQENNFYYNFLNQHPTGTFWEMPFVYKFDSNNYMLQVTHNGGGAPADSKYWIGSINSNKVFVPHDVNAKTMEVISKKMLAPAIGVDSAGQPIYIGIIVEDGDVAQQKARGWRQTFSIPRKIRLLANNKIGQVPHENLQKLRKNYYQITNRIITTGTEWNIPEIESRQMEMHYRISFEPDAIFSMHLFKNWDKQENTILNFNTKDNRLSVNRTNHTLSPGIFPVTNGNYTFRADGKLDVRIFLDNSIFEVFVDSIEVFSGRLYTSRTSSNKIDLTVFRKQVTIDTLDAWQMANDDSIYTGINISTNKILGTNPSELFKISPNPSQGQLQIQFLEDGIDTFDYEIFDANGSVLQTEMNRAVGNLNLIDTNLSSGIYF